MDQKKQKIVAVIVAHPDDETLWTGGTILSHPSWNWFIISLCRASDTDRAPKFFQVLKILGSRGTMGDLDDGPEQKPMDEKEVQELILKLLPQKHFDILISHSPSGEYTRHIRHEETSKAIIKLWHKGKISTDELWTFAYEDGHKKYLPRAIKSAAIYRELPGRIWKIKYRIVTEIYGFDKNSFEAKTTPRAESFWRLTNSRDAIQTLDTRSLSL